MTQTTPRIKRRRARVRSKISGTPEVPRVCVFRSNRYLYAQVIDDVTRRTLASVSSQRFEKADKSTKTNAAREAGQELAKTLQEKSISRVVFDRNRFLYLGRVKNFAEGLREGGIQV